MKPPSALDVECPFCGSAPGARCTNVITGSCRAPHDKRMEVAVRLTPMLAPVEDTFAEQLASASSKTTSEDGT